MLVGESGEFDLETTFIYDKEWSDILFHELLANQAAIKAYASQSPDLQKLYDENINVFQKEADKYDPYAENQQDENFKTAKYSYVYSSMYNFTPSRDLFGREKPFNFIEEFERISTTFGVDRSRADITVTTPYFVPIAPQNIKPALLRLADKLEFEWNNDNPLVIISKMVPYITAIQPLNDGNHRASHAMLQYYLGKAGLPSILRKKGLNEHYNAYTLFEKNAIVGSSLNGNENGNNIDDLIAYYYINVLERQEELCHILGVDPRMILVSKTRSAPDEPIDGCIGCML